METFVFYRLIKIFLWKLIWRRKGKERGQVGKEVRERKREICDFDCHKEAFGAHLRVCFPLYEKDWLLLVTNLLFF